jgi:hypothetical protein
MSKIVPEDNQYLVDNDVWTGSDLDGSFYHATKEIVRWLIESARINLSISVSNSYNLFELVLCSLPLIILG